MIRSSHVGDIKNMTLTTKDVSLSEAVTRTLEKFASREAATVSDVLSLARSLPQALMESQADVIPEATQAELVQSIQFAQPAVPVEDSWDDDSVTCLCCGRSFTMLKRHLKAEHGLTEAEYRARFNLSDDHPLTAPNYSLRKAEHAKQIGLGKYSRDDDAQSGATLPS